MFNLLKKPQADALVVSELQIKSQENLELHIYKCSEGFNSIAWGFNLDANDITVEIAQMLFDLKFKPAVKDAKDFAGEAWDKLNVARQAVLINMAYNLGRAGLMKMWTLQIAVREQRFKYAAQRMRSFLWYRQIQKYVKPPVIGRAEELAKQMETGEVQ